MACPGRQAHTGLRRKGSSKQGPRHLEPSIPPFPRFHSAYKFPVAKFLDCLLIEFPGFQCHIIFNLYSKFAYRCKCFSVFRGK